jgi:hypothetical protein
MNRRSSRGRSAAQRSGRAAATARNGFLPRLPKLADAMYGLCPAGHQKLPTSEAGSEVYGATPFSEARKNTILRGHTRGVQNIGRRGPSEESAEAPWSVPSRTEQTTDHVERSLLWPTR